MKPIRSIATGLLVGSAVTVGVLAGASGAAHASTATPDMAQADVIPGLGNLGGLGKLVGGLGNLGGRGAQSTPARPAGPRELGAPGNFAPYGPAYDAPFTEVYELPGGSYESIDGWRQTP